MSSDRRSVTFGIIVFVILVVGAYMALRELASAELRQVTSTPPAVTFPPPPFSIPTPTGFTLCSGSGGATPQGSPSLAGYCGR